MLMVNIFGILLINTNVRKFRYFTFSLSFIVHTELVDVQNKLFLYVLRIKVLTHLFIILLTSYHIYGLINDTKWLYLWKNFEVRLKSLFASKEDCRCQIHICESYIMEVVFANRMHSYFWGEYIINNFSMS